MCFGDMNTLPGSKEVFYCDKGEKCCPKPPQGEECAKICPTYDKEGIVSKKIILWPPFILRDNVVE